MVEYYKDGITVQALSAREEAELKKLGFVKAEVIEPVEKEPAEKKSAKAGK